MPRITVDQWLLEYLRSQELINTAYGEHVYIYEVPAGTQMPYIHILLISGVRKAKTQTVRDAGRSRFQIDAYGSDRYQVRENIEQVIQLLQITNVAAEDLKIEKVEISGPRRLPSEQGFRFSFDALITWNQER